MHLLARLPDKKRDMRREIQRAFQVESPEKQLEQHSPVKAVILSANTRDDRRGFLCGLSARVILGKIAVRRVQTLNASAAQFSGTAPHMYNPILMIITLDHD
jgi:hypothetical protein